MLGGGPIVMHGKAEFAANLQRRGRPADAVLGFVWIR
jgi:hypothetical protein